MREPVRHLPFHSGRSLLKPFPSSTSDQHPRISHFEHVDPAQARSRIDELDDFVRRAGRENSWRPDSAPSSRCHLSEETPLHLFCFLHHCCIFTNPIAKPPRVPFSRAAVRRCSHDADIVTSNGHHGKWPPEIGRGQLLDLEVCFISTGQALGTSSCPRFTTPIDHRVVLTMLIFSCHQDTCKNSVSWTRISKSVTTPV